MTVTGSLVSVLITAGLFGAVGAAIVGGGVVAVRRRGGFLVRTLAIAAIFLGVLLVIYSIGILTFSAVVVDFS